MNNSIYETPITIAIQAVHAINDLKQVLYGECLARTMKSDGTIASIAHHIACLEKSNAIIDFDLSMLNLVLAKLDENPVAVLGLNVSAISLCDVVARKRLISMITRKPSLAMRLVVEVTETSPLSDLAFARSFLNEIKSYGCQIALDDFGTGYATPVQLLSLDFDIIKIDKLFVKQVLSRSPHQGNSLHHLVGFAACVAPIIIIEGVETSEHFLYAAETGATHIQGYFASHPILSPEARI
ncbi:EAL domain-containing protein [Ochrobactrum sp. SFR4]|uniref:EAL domain-containing protein n=1 Tax=Ochrobactrum sp. SFR4 TaxID=2717368 RepID=UPI001C8C621C|nr:EAL domain-containing protein [Ochrobactrum sp. SFR4]MBX8827396.1 EAL domain-containing protein [Ochrobactrum sp. SFR4]